MKKNFVVRNRVEKTKGLSKLMDVYVIGIKEIQIPGDPVEGNHVLRGYMHLETVDERGIHGHTVSVCNKGQR